MLKNIPTRKPARAVFAAGMFLLTAAALPAQTPVLRRRTRPSSAAGRRTARAPSRRLIELRAGGPGLSSKSRRQGWPWSDPASTRPGARRLAVPRRPGAECHQFRRLGRPGPQRVSAGGCQRCRCRGPAGSATRHPIIPELRAFLDQISPEWNRAPPVKPGRLPFSWSPEPGTAIRDLHCQGVAAVLHPGGEPGCCPPREVPSEFPADSAVYAVGSIPWRR